LTAAVADGQLSYYASLDWTALRTAIRLAITFGKSPDKARTRNLSIVAFPPNLFVVGGDLFALLTAILPWCGGTICQALYIFDE